MKKNNNLKKLILILFLIVSITVIIRITGVYKYISLENAKNLQKWIYDFGILGPIIYILIYILACIFFLPGLPITIIGALAFGPIKGSIFSIIGSTLGSGAAFLIARYAARNMVEKWVEGNDTFKKIDIGVEKQGWRMLMITRLVPIFPFNLQNFAYGLTKIKFSTYLVVSCICMTPAAIAFNFMAGSVVNGEGNLGKTFMYLGIGAVLFVIVSLIPGVIRKKNISKDI